MLLVQASDIKKHMIFDLNSIDRLTSMGIDAKLYEQSLILEFSDKAFIFQELVVAFWKKQGHEMSTESFNQFYAKRGYQTQGGIHDKAYDFFNYLRLFNNDGKLGLYKGRQAEWEGPRIKLEKSDVPNSNISDLAGISEIYRGMSIDEFQSENFGQSWTIDILTAERFARGIYHDKPDGIVAVTKLDLANVIYHSKDDNEREVIISYGCILSAKKLNAELIIQATPLCGA